MRKQVIVAGVAAVVALAAIGFVLASNGGDDEPRVENPPLPTAPLDGGSGGGAAGACPGPDVPGVTQEERERCFDQDSPGGGVVILPGESPIPSEPQVPVTPIDPGTDPELPADRQPEAAPIDGLQLNVAESFPPQYFLNVQAGLPSGCVQQYRYDVERDGNVITVTVLNSIPTATDIACTTIYGIYELNIPLGTDFEPGEGYTVNVNGQQTLDFIAQ